MSKRIVNIRNLSIVLVGNFNPSIIHPSWLALKDLIRNSESTNATNRITHPEISDFSLTFVDIQVTKDKFNFICKNESNFKLTKELAVNIFRILDETPIDGVGLNYHMHFGLNDKEEYAKFGNWLTPLNKWSDVLFEPRLLDMKIVEPVKSDSPERCQVSISPSDKIKTNGVEMVLNYHIDLTKYRDISVESAIVNHWVKSSEKAQSVFNSIMDKFDKNE